MSEKTSFKPEMLQKLSNPEAVCSRVMAMALHHAAETGHIMRVHDLIAAGAALEARDKDGKTALMLAAEYNHTSIVRALLTAGADKEATDNEGKTALMLAAQRGETCSMQALLDAGADKNAADDTGTTVLHKAVGYPNAIRTLAAAGANLEARDGDGKTALIHAAANACDGEECVYELIAAGAELDAQDNEGNTALILAAGDGYIDAVSALIGAGAHVNIRNNSGETAQEKAQHGAEHDDWRGEEKQEVVHILQQACNKINNHANATRWLRWMALEGHEGAMLELGKIYLAGYTIEKDVDKAIIYFQKAADRANHEAMMMLGSMYRDGNGVQQDGKKAISYFLDAVNRTHDNGEAQSALGEMYRLGSDGVKKDMAKALRWHGKAARNFYRYAYGGERSREILQLLARQGIAEAAFLMGEAYRRNHGDAGATPSCKEAEKTAVQWYLCAIGLGSAEAAEALEHIKNTVRDRLLPHEAEALNNGDISLEKLLKRRNRTQAVIGNGLSLEELEELLQSQNSTGE